MRFLTAIHDRPFVVRVLLALAVVTAVGVLIAASTVLETWAVPLDYLRNAAAPYLLVPFAVGALSRTRRGAAVSGVLTSWALIDAYYQWASIVIPAGFRRPIAEAVFWAAAAVVSGSVAGLLGRSALGRPVLRWVVPAVLLLEPVAWWVLLRAGVAPVLGNASGVLGGLVEAGAGAVAALVLWRDGRRAPAGPVLATCPAAPSGLGSPLCPSTASSPPRRRRE